MSFKPFALVGGMGCGKTTAMEFFANEGFDIVNSDKLLHNMYESSHSSFTALATKLDEFLGTSFIEDKAISRLILREKVGFDKSNLQKMIEITCPFIGIVGGFFIHSNFYWILFGLVPSFIIPLSIEAEICDKARNKKSQINLEFFEKIESNPEYLKEIAKLSVDEKSQSMFLRIVDNFLKK